MNDNQSWKSKRNINLVSIHLFFYSFVANFISFAVMFIVYFQLIRKWTLLVEHLFRSTHFTNRMAFILSNVLLVLRMQQDLIESNYSL